MCLGASLFLKPECQVVQNWGSSEEGKSVLIQLRVSQRKPALPHPLHKAALGRPSLPFTTDSVNWHTYLFETEISWGGECEWRVASGLKRKKKKKGHCWVSRRRCDLSTSPLPRHSKQSQPRSRHNSLHSADAQCRTMEEGPYKYMTVRRPDKEARKVCC